jgi:hypothetical protein
MMQQLAQQKAGQTHGSPAMGPSGAGSSSDAPGQAGSPVQTPRPFTGPLQELKYFGDDALDAALRFMPQFMRNMFGRSAQDTPETVAKKKQMLQKYQALTAEQQQYAQQRLQQQHQKEQQEAQEKQQKKQAEEQQQKQDLSMPSGKRSGDGALQKMNDDRKKLGSAGAG